MSLMRFQAGRIRQTLAYVASAGLNLLYPGRCVWCAAELPEDALAAGLCGDCSQRLAPASPAGCPRCGAPKNPRNDKARDCRFCKKTPLQFDTAIPLGSYKDELREVVLRMKRPGSDALAAAMGRLLATQCHDRLAAMSVDCIVPIPMHWFRRVCRGTNSPEILAQCLGKSLDVPVYRGALVRRRNTQPQFNLTPKERLRNLRGAFQLGGKRLPPAARVLLVDDILTTGATCSEAASVLKQAVAESVAVAVLARAHGTDSV